MLTIISASYKSRALLEVNYDLVRALNPGASFRWIVVQNTPQDSRAGDLDMTDRRFEMIRGPVLTPLERQSVAYGSYHHAKALNLAADYTDSDLLLTLDPDCFVLMPNWISRVTEHVQKEGIAFFGTPYHPRHFINYRGFPNVVCMLINRRLVQQSDCFTLNFMPDADRKSSRQAMREAIQYQTRNYKRLMGFVLGRDRHKDLELSDWRLVIGEWLRTQVPQLKVGRYSDTGSRLFHQYRSLFKHEELAVYALDDRGLQGKLLESILPDRYRRFPRDLRRIHSTPDAFLAEFESQCEQFFWNGSLFAFHVNGTWYSEEFKQRVYSQLIDKLQSFIAQLAGREANRCEPTSPP